MTHFRCPNCKEKKGVVISYGYPSDELFEAADRNEAVLGGCMQAEGDPDRQCLSCGHQWVVSPPSDEEDEEVMSPSVARLIQARRRALQKNLKP